MEIINYKGFRYKRMLPPTVSVGEPPYDMGPRLYDESEVKQRERESRLDEAKQWVSHRPGDGFYDRRVRELTELSKLKSQPKEGGDEEAKSSRQS